MMDMPLIGLGTWPLKGAECSDTVAMALELGYRHVDTAQMYENEEAVGQGLRAGGVPREQVFLTTKIHQDRFVDGTALDSAKASIDRLGVGPVDLILCHWPPRGVETEAVVDALEEVRAAGLTRHIGISNHNRPQMRAAAARGSILTNQVEFHALIDQFALQEQAKALGISLTAYMPVARGKVMEAPLVQAIAEETGYSAAQVGLRWIVQQGVHAICMSTKRRNLEANLQVLDFELSAGDMAALDTLARSRNSRFCDMEGWSPVWDAD